MGGYCQTIYMDCNTLEQLALARLLQLLGLELFLQFGILELHILLERPIMIHGAGIFLLFAGLLTKPGAAVGGHDSISCTFVIKTCIVACMPVYFSGTSCTADDNVNSLRAVSCAH